MSKRKAISKRTANQVELPRVPRLGKHAKMLNDMHDALYALSNSISPIPKPSDGVTNLVPKALQRSVAQDNQLMAKGHIANLHKGFKAAAKTHLPKGQKNGT